MDEFALQEMKKGIEQNTADIAGIKKLFAMIIKSAPKHIQEKVEKESKKISKTARQNAEDGEPDTTDLNKMSIARLKQRLESHRQNERETFTKKEAEAFTKLEQKIVKALQKAIKEKRTKNVSN